MGFERDAYATRIKSLRKKSGLTQEQLAEKINVTSTYIVKIENSQRTGSIEFSVELAKCFGVSLDYLLLGEEVGNKKQVLQRVIRSSKPKWMENSSPWARMFSRPSPVSEPCRSSLR